MSQVTVIQPTYPSYQILLFVGAWQPQAFIVGAWRPTPPPIFLKIGCNMDDGTDKFSSIVDVPSCLKREYDSLVPIAREHSVKFPASGEYESNSGGMYNTIKEG